MGRRILGQKQMIKKMQLEQMNSSSFFLIEIFPFKSNHTNFRNLFTFRIGEPINEHEKKTVLSFEMMAQSQTNNNARGH